MNKITINTKIKDKKKKYYQKPKILNFGSVTELTKGVGGSASADMGRADVKRGRGQG